MTDPSADAAAARGEAARRHPGWRDHARLLAEATEAGATAAALTKLLPAGTRTASGGHRVRFRDAATLPGVDYESHVYATGEVATRGGDFHDLANALAWARWPKLKAAINAAHCHEMESGRAARGTRGPVRDALTLFDESGAILATPHRELLRALAAHDWEYAFRGLREHWTESSVFVFGHAVLEKLAAPWKSITAHALLVSLPAEAPTAPREDLLRALDAGLARSLLARGLLRSTGELSPLPVAGIPGWWKAAPQDEGFYADCRVFRTLPRGRSPAPILAWSPAPA